MDAKNVALAAQAIQQFRGIGDTLSNWAGRKTTERAPISTATVAAGAVAVDLAASLAKTGSGRVFMAVLALGGGLTWGRAHYIAEGMTRVPLCHTAEVLAVVPGKP